MYVVSHSLTVRHKCKIRNAELIKKAKLGTLSIIYEYLAVCVVRQSMSRPPISDRVNRTDISGTTVAILKFHNRFIHTGKCGCLRYLLPL